MGAHGLWLNSSACMIYHIPQMAYECIFVTVHKASGFKCFLKHLHRISK